MVVKMDPKQVSLSEPLLALKAHRTIPSGETIARAVKPGEVYKQSGIAKVEAIAHGLATLDLKAKVPVNDKREAPEKGKEKYRNPYELLAEQNAKILELLTQLLADKKK